MECCNEEQTSSTFGEIFYKCQSWIVSLLTGDIFGSSVNNDPNDEEDKQNVIVSVLFVLHITVVFFFLAHHCSPRGVAQGGLSIIRRGLATSAAYRANDWWVKRQVNDPFVKQARAEGYRCRSAFKLLQINEKFKMLKPGMVVMECGCSPGSWSQVAAKLINAGGRYSDYEEAGILVGCDLLDVEPIPGAKLLPRRDFTDEEAQKKLRELAEHRAFDVVLSDMAPNASGMKSLDHERLMRLAWQVREFTLANGVLGTSMAIKVWQGNLLAKFTDLLKEDFQQVYTFKPKASRNDSAEIYLVALNLMNPNTTSN